MKKKQKDDDLAIIIENIVKNQSGTVNNQQKFANLLERVIDLVEFLMKSISIIIFFIMILILKVFLWDPFSKTLNNISEKWASLSEGFQLLILGFIGTIIAGIIAHIAGSLLLSKIKKILKKE